MIRLKNDSGFALILTLVITALMVAVVVEMIHQVYVDTSHSRGFRDGLQASMLAESGVEGVVKLIMPRIALSQTTSLSDAWAFPIKLDDEAGSLIIMITEESGKININDLVQQNGKYDPFTQIAMQQLGTFLIPQLPVYIWPSVANWISTIGITDPSGAAPSYYSALNPPYKPRNLPLLTLTELTLIKGVTPDMPRMLRPFVTTFSEFTPAVLSMVNINTAPKEVLEALIDPGTAEKIMAQRSIKAIADVGSIAGTKQGLVGRISVKGNVFRITSVATVKDSIRTVEAVVRLGTAELSNTIPTGFLSWQEY